MARASGIGPTVAGNEPGKTTPLFGKWTLVSLVVLGALVVVGAVLIWTTGDAMANLPFLQNGKGGVTSQPKTLVDETPWATAQALAALAVTQEELTYAREAEHLADHDVDQAFAAALRAATLKQKSLTGGALEAQQRVKEMESTVASDQDSVKQLTAKGGDDLEVAQAQLSLDQDEMADAREDLARASGDQRGEIQQELNTRQADMKRFDAAQNTGEVAVISVKRYRTLAGLIGAWSRQNQRYGLLLNAKASALQNVARFNAEHDRLEGLMKSQGAGASQDAGAPDTAAKRVAGMNRLSLQRQLMVIYDDRVDTEQRLSDVYGKWAAQVALQHRIVRHLILVQIMWIAVILILAILL